MKKVAIFHTTASTLAMLTALVSEIMPKVNVMHIVEESMIKDVMAHNGVTPEINARIVAYIKAAEVAKCDIFMTACSSIGDVIAQCQFMTSMLLTRIDTAMIEQAVQIGGKVAVLATVETTLRPTLTYLKRMVDEQNKVLDIKPCLMVDAYSALLANNIEQHNAIVKQGLLKAAKDSDVIVLAQASMANVLDSLDEAINIPVLTSPASGIKWLQQRLAD